MVAAENHSIWITANAGSGKTTALTRRVLQLLLRGVEPERICCLTYTKAAASEMRARVLARLRDLLLAVDAECESQVSDLLGSPATPEHINLARSLFGRVLDSASGGVQLTTIHGFCQNILRRFPLEADVSPHFTVPEDATTDSLMAQARHRLLGRLEGDDADLRAALELLGERSGEFMFDKIAGTILGKRALWESIWRGQTPPLLRARIFALHGLAEDTSSDTLTEAFCALPDGAMLNLLRADLPALLAHKNKAEQAIGAVYAQWLERPPQARAAMLDGLLKCWCNADGAMKKKPFSVKEGAPLYDTLNYLQQTAERFAIARAGAQCAEESFAVAIIARSLLDLYAQAKTQGQMLDYDDLITKTCELFANPNMLGWVMSKLDHRIDHLLVDEAQDTSAAQWQIVRTLVEELIASNDGVGSGNVARSLLVVGDEKQSIYSFQGAAPQLFAGSFSRFDALLAYSAAPLKPALLATSYRSAPAILRFVDAVAARPEIALALSSAGQPAPHTAKRADAAGLVMLHTPIDAPEREKLPPMTIPIEYRIEQNAAQMMAERMAETVAQWLAQKRVIAATGQPIQPGDIVILVQNRHPLVLPLIRMLERKSVPVAGLDRLNLADHLAVRDLLALMRWCTNTADDLALAQVLRSPLIGITDDALRALAYGRSSTLWEVVRENAAYAPALTHWRAHSQASPYDFLTMLLEEENGRQRFAARFGAEVHEVLDELKAQSTAMPMGMQATVANFEAWMAKSERSIKREQEQATGNQLRIMTVHGAKGLEAPVVILADMGRMPTTQQESIYFAENPDGQVLPLVALSDDAKHADNLVQAKEDVSERMRAEYYRLLYVALTRARDELHVFGLAGKKGDVKAGSWFDVLRSTMQDMPHEKTEEALVLHDYPVVIDVRNAGIENGERLPRGSSLPLRGRVGEGQNRAMDEPMNGPHLTSPLGGEEFWNSMQAFLQLPNWAKHNPQVAPVAFTTISPSRLVEETPTISPYVQAAERGAKERGVRIHRVLQFMRATSDETFIRRLVAHVAPDWDAPTQAEVLREVMALKREAGFLWQGRAMAEVNVGGSIAMGDARVPISGQIDLLVELPDAWVVVDYKTGRHVPVHASEVSLSYLLQLKTYHALVTAIYPDKPVRCAILWTAKPALMWLDAEVAAAAWPNQFVTNIHGFAA